jgi:hypothetical protein
MDRILSPGGILVVRAPLLTKDFYSDLSHIRPYNPKVILKYLTPTQQRTFPHISDDYELISLKWRHKQFNLNRRYVNLIGHAINHLQIPLLPKTGYLLVLGKRSLTR